MIAGAMVSLTLTGCGDGTEVLGRPEVPPTQETGAEPAATGNDASIQEYEAKYKTGEFSQEDHKALAGLYAQEGYILKQRDMLEQSVSVYNDREAFDALQEIVVNGEEENSTVKEELQRLEQNLSIAEYLNEAVGMMNSQEWYDAMMPRLAEGHRRYYLEDKENGTLMTAEVGYDGAGEKYSSVWYVIGGSQLTYLTQNQYSVQMVTTGLSEGKYNGPFDAWLCLASSGDVYYETGTFENGLYSGDYTAKVRFGTEATDLFALWGTRGDMEMETYSGNFGGGGITAVSQEALNGSEKKDKEVIYAIKEDKSGYLSMNAGEGTEAGSFVFDSSVLGMTDYPAVNGYEPKASGGSIVDEGAGVSADGRINSSDVQVRVNNSNVEWFDGRSWHIVGTVEELVNADPSLNGDNGTGENGAGADAAGGRMEALGRRSGGSAAATPPAATPKPSTNKPAATPKPTPKPTPTPAPTPTPTPPPSQGGQDPQPPASTPTPPPSTPPDVGGEDDGGNGGNAGGDVDVDWSDDIL